MKWGIYMQFNRHICSGTNAIHVKCVYNRPPGAIVDCTEFIRGFYTDSCVSSCVMGPHELISICGILKGLFVASLYMAIT